MWSWTVKEPKVVKLSPEETDSLLHRAATNTLTKEDVKIITGMSQTIVFLCLKLDEKNFSLKRAFRRMLGMKTEKKRTILNTGKDHNTSDMNNAGEATADEVRKSSENNDKPVKKQKGHGRNGANAYTGAERTFVSLGIESGSLCTLCAKGKLYKVKQPGMIVGIFGRAPLQARIWEYEKYRCNLCGAILEPELPEEAKKAKEKKYDETAISMIALLKYGFGLPFYRQEKLQACLGIPLPTSTQWDKAESGADLIYRAFEEMKRQAAQGDIIHNDDTTAKILELKKINDDPEKKDEGESCRKGMFTTGILSVKDERKIALFFTGQQHAGENFADLLKKRESDRGPPIQMCDALSRNYSEYSEVVLAHCNVHARRNFVDVSENFPEECRYVLEVFEEIYKYDDITKKQDMLPEERLQYHQAHSEPVMKNFHNWLQEQFEKKKVEPNSSLGQAISYMLDHWKELTRFLEVAGVPLDNNIVERALKRVILHRKNSLFFKTLHGAYIGDMYMSLIYTCILTGGDPFDYLTELQKHSSDVFKNSEQWMPWNYRSTIGKKQLIEDAA